MKRIQNWMIFTLISIVIIAIILRLIKLYEFAIWGSDSGEHYYLLSQMIESGQIQLEYSGWGFAYPYFPGMHIFTSGFADLAGISAYHVLIFLIPVTAALSVILVFGISYRITRDPRIGLVAAGFLAVVLPHVYSSSHPMPGSLGGLFVLTCIFLLLKSYENKKFLVLLGLSTIALVVTHHMSIYFLIITLVAVILFREFLQYNKNDKPTWFDKTWLDLGYLTFLITISMGYWLYYAEPFYDRILSRGLPFPSIGLVIFAYISIIFLWIIIRYRRKWEWAFKPRTLSGKNLLIRIIIFPILGMVILGITAITGVPGTNMQTDIISLPLFLPIVILMSFMSAAPAFLFHYRDGIFIFSWLVAILMSLIFAFITNSQELLLYRHLPYIFEPITILAGVGIVKSFDLQASKKNSKMILLESNDQVIYRNSSNNKPEIAKKKVNDNAVYIKNAYSSLPSRFAFAGFISILIVICGLYSYPPLEVVSGFEEGTSPEEFDSCFWVRENLPESATVASDHRMSSMVFGFSGLNASWEYAPKIIHGKSYEEIRSELEEANIPSGKKRMDYILISEAIKHGVALKQWETAEPMSDEALWKFEKEPFIKIYDNGEVQVYYYASSAEI